MRQIGCKMECPHMGLIHPGFIRGSDTLQSHGTGCHLPCHSQAVKSTIAQESNKPTLRALTCMTQSLHLSDHHMRLEHVLFWIAQCELLLWNSHSQMDNKSTCN